MTEKSQIKRLTEIYKDLPKKQLALAQGLIAEAARLRVRCDDLWKDIQQNGEVEMFSQSESAEPYERQRPASRIYTAANKSYQSIMKQLNDMLPKDDDTGGDVFDCE